MNLTMSCSRAADKGSMAWAASPAGRRASHRYPGRSSALARPICGRKRKERECSEAPDHYVIYGVLPFFRILGLPKLRKYGAPRIPTAKARAPKIPNFLPISVKSLPQVTGKGIA